MPRETLLPRYKGYSWAIGVGVVTERPDLLRLIGEAITIWPYVEHQMAISLSMILGAENKPTVAAFSKIRQGQTQREILTVAAELTKNDDDVNLIKNCLKIIRSSEAHRNDLVHGHWGYISDVDDVLIWIDAKYHSSWNATAISSVDAESKSHHHLLEKWIYVYDKVSLNEILDKIRECWKISFNLTLYLKDRYAAAESKEVLRERIETSKLYLELSRS